MTKTKNKNTSTNTIKSPWDGVEPSPILVNLIKVDPKVHVRKHIDPATVKRYTNILKSAKTMPPIKVAVINNVAVVLDGWHRLEAMKELGWEETYARVITTTEKKARWLSASSNLEHGLPLRSRELKNVFKAFVEAGQHRNESRGLLSYREIAMVIGVTHNTIRNWMFKLFPRIAKEYSRENPNEEDFHGEGGCYPIDTTKQLRVQIATSLAEVIHVYHGNEDPEVKAFIHEELKRSIEATANERHWEPCPF